ncbi:lateral flagellar hook-associated protein 2 [Ditylenchus destructor]|nr:lateral flagellar hook-associated protein 2 [Ditylenchus destructor]
MVVTVGGATQLMLTSGVSGAGGKLTIDTSGLSAPPRTALDDTSKRKELGVTITLKKAQTTGDSPVTLAVARDDQRHTTKLQNFIDAYNTLEKTLDGLTQVGKEGVANGAFASDAGVRAMRDRIGNLLRADYGGSNLRTLGVSIARDGVAEPGRHEASKALAATPDALDKVMGSTALSSSSGVRGALDKLADGWTNSSSGQIKQRQTTVQAQQKSIRTPQTRLTDQYNQAYQRYPKKVHAAAEPAVATVGDEQHVRRRLGRAGKTSSLR